MKMKLSNLKQIVVGGLVTVILLFNSRCGYVALGLCSYALLQAAEQRIELEEARSRARRVREYSTSLTIEKRLVIQQSNAQSSDSNQQLKYSENVYRNLEITIKEKLRECESRKENLSELEQALAELRSEVISPILEAKARYENFNK